MNEAPVVREVDGLLVIDWPNPRSEQFLISADLFEELIGLVNVTLSLPTSEPVCDCGHGLIEHESQNRACLVCGCERFAVPQDGLDVLAAVQGQIGRSLGDASG